MNQTQTIEQLEHIIQNYITFFIVFDIVIDFISYLCRKKSKHDSTHIYGIHKTDCGRGCRND